MDYRKIIKFGNSSHVISLPCTWLEKNKLGKGDVVYFTENGGKELILAPTQTEKTREVLSYTINADGLDIHDMKRRIVSCYIGGYDIITITGNPQLINKYGDEIRRLLDRLSALEVIEHNKDKIVAKDLLDPSQFSLDNSIRRVDIIIKSMVYDIINKTEHYDRLKIRDADINRIVYLSLRMIKKQMRFNDSQKNNPVKLLAAWELLTNMEHLADELKRISKCLNQSKIKNSKLTKEFLSCFGMLAKEYDNAMKYYFTKDQSQAHKIPAIKEKIVKCCNNIASRNQDVQLGNALEKLMASASFLRNLARVVHDLG